MSASARARNARVFWGTALSVIALDLVTKMLAVAHLTEHVPHPVVGEVVRFTLAFNPGAAFSMSLGRNSRFIFGAFAVVALIILWRVYERSRPNDLARVFALGLAWGGAAGNLIDRLHRSQGVVDFIDIGVGDLRYWTFNVADSAVTIGAIMLAWALWRQDRRTLATAAAEAAARDETSAG